MAHFETHLKQLMLKKSVELGHSLTQREVAQSTGLSIPAISRWYQSNVDRLEIDTVKALVDYFECSFADLVDYKN